MSTSLSDGRRYERERLRGLEVAVADWCARSGVHPMPREDAQGVPVGYFVTATPVQTGHSVDGRAGPEAVIKFRCTVEALFFVVLRSYCGTTDAGVESTPVWAGLVRIRRVLAWVPEHPEKEETSAWTTGPQIGDDQIELCRTLSCGVLAAEEPEPEGLAGEIREHVVGGVRDVLQRVCWAVLAALKEEPDRASRP